MDVNYGIGEVSLKVVFYGPGLSGKTTNLEIIHSKVATNNRGNLTAIATQQDRTLFFDFMPLDLGKVGGLKTKLRLFTIPGQVYYNSTRKLVLQRVDGVVFVADSQTSKRDENIEAMENLEQNLKENGIDIRSIPLVLQYNKRDLPDILSIAELNLTLNSQWNAPAFPAIAITGEGVFPTLKAIAGMVLKSVEDMTKGASVKSTAAVGSLTTILKKQTESVEKMGSITDRISTATSERINAASAFRSKTPDWIAPKEKNITTAEKMNPPTPRGNITDRIVAKEKAIGLVERPIPMGVSNLPENPFAKDKTSSILKASTPSERSGTSKLINQPERAGTTKLPNPPEFTTEKRGSTTARLKPIITSVPEKEKTKDTLSVFSPAFSDPKRRKPNESLDPHNWDFEGDPYAMEEEEEQ